MLTLIYLLCLHSEENMNDQATSDVRLKWNNYIWTQSTLQIGTYSTLNDLSFTFRLNSSLALNDAAPS